MNPSGEILELSNDLIMINDKIKGDRIWFDNNKKVVENQKMSRYKSNNKSSLSNVGDTSFEETSETYRGGDMKNLHQRHLQAIFKTSRYHKWPDRQTPKKDDDKTVKSVKERVKDLGLNDKKLVNVKNVVKRDKCSINPNKMTKSDKKTDKKYDKKYPILKSERKIEKSIR